MKLNWKQNDSQPVKLGEQQRRNQRNFGLQVIYHQVALRAAWEREQEALNQHERSFRTLFPSFLPSFLIQPNVKEQRGSCPNQEYQPASQISIFLNIKLHIGGGIIPKVIFPIKALCEWIRWTIIMCGIRPWLPRERISSFFLPNSTRASTSCPHYLPYLLLIIYLIYSMFWRRFIPSFQSSAAFLPPCYYEGWRP